MTFFILLLSFPTPNLVLKWTIMPRTVSEAQTICNLNLLNTQFQLSAKSESQVAENYLSGGRKNA